MNGTPVKSKVLSYQDLLVWQKAMDLVEAIYILARLLPKTEEYRLIGQMTRAAVSVPANIAEGHARATRKEYAHFISIAQGSLAEVETYLALVVRLKFVAKQETCTAESLSDEVSRMLRSLHHRLQNDAPST